jgi:hypothetical protein
MGTHVRRRFWVEVVGALIVGALAIVTVAWPTWFEGLTGIAPDRGDGGLEWMIIFVFAAASVGTALIARREWRRQRLALSA